MKTQYEWITEIIVEKQEIADNLKLEIIVIKEFDNLIKLTREKYSQIFQEYKDNFDEYEEMCKKYYNEDIFLHIDNLIVNKYRKKVYGEISLLVMVLVNLIIFNLPKQHNNKDIL